MIALDVLVGVSYLLAALLLRRVRQLALLAAATGVLWFAADLVQPWCSPIVHPSLTCSCSIPAPAFDGAANAGLSEPCTRPV